MTKIEVVLSIGATDGRALAGDSLDGDSWGVDENGVLTVRDGNNMLVATYAAGKWFRVLRHPD
jgi:hypothetical protein